MRKPRISVALATWNGEKFLKEQLESYVSQTVLPDELVVSDDHSRDATVQIVSEFAKRAPFAVVVLQNPARQGYAENFARAIENCSGDIILLSDQDDIWLPHHVEKLVACFESREVLLALSRSRHFRIDKNGVRREWPIEAPWYKAHRKWNWQLCEQFGLIIGFVKHWVPPFAGHGIAFRSCLSKLVLPVAADWHDFWIDSIASAVGDYVFVDDVLTLHRVHERNASGFGMRKTASERLRRTASFQKELTRIIQFQKRLEAVDGSAPRVKKSLMVAERAASILTLRMEARTQGACGLFRCIRAFVKGDYRWTSGAPALLRDVYDFLRSGW